MSPLSVITIYATTGVIFTLWSLWDSWKDWRAVKVAGNGLRSVVAQGFLWLHLTLLVGYGLWLAIGLNAILTDAPGGEWGGPIILLVIAEIAFGLVSIELRGMRFRLSRNA